MDDDVPYTDDIKDGEEKRSIDADEDQREALNSESDNDNETSLYYDGRNHPINNFKELLSRFVLKPQLIPGHRRSTFGPRLFWENHTIGEYQ